MREGERAILDQSRNPSRKQESERGRERERERERVSETGQEGSVDFQCLLSSHRGNRTYSCQQIYNHMRFRAINQHSISLRLTVNK